MTHIYLTYTMWFAALLLRTVLGDEEGARFLMLLAISMTLVGITLKLHGK